jgi:hypothetical protein
MIKFSENDPPPQQDEKAEEEKHEEKIDMKHESDEKGNASDTENEAEEKKGVMNIIPAVFDPETSWLCCTTYKDRSRFKSILQYLDLDPLKKEIIKTRYLDILQNLQKRCRNHGIIFFVGHFIITVGSLFVPALLSIQNSDKEYTLVNASFNVQIYWATFIISLLVTIWNGILTLFQIDKKYYFLNTILECLRSEGWQYMSLTGRYSGGLVRGKKPTHDNQFIHFTHYIEKIKMKQIEEEYYRTDDKTQAPNSATQRPNRSVNPTNGPTNPTGYPTGMADGYPQSLDKPLSVVGQQSMPDSVRNVYESLAQSQQPPYYGAATSMPFSVLSSGSGYYEPSFRNSSVASKPTIVEKPIWNVVEKVVQVEKPVYIEKIVEKPVYVEVPVVIPPEPSPPPPPPPPKPATSPPSASPSPLARSMTSTFFSHEPVSTSTAVSDLNPASGLPVNSSTAPPKGVKDTLHPSYRDIKNKLKPVPPHDRETSAVKPSQINL